MQLSRDEFLRVSQLEPARSSVMGLPIGNIATAPMRRRNIYDSGSFSLMEESREIAEKVETQQDHREEIIASLRNRIEAGTYFVTGEQIADMLLRRLLADRMQ